MWLLYNHCSPSQLASLKRWNDSGHKVSIGCPRAIHDYFFGARSVDIINQHHYSYLIGRKSRKSWCRLAWWLIDMCIVNAFTLWSIDNEGATHLHFREELMHSLVKLFGSNQEAVQASRGANVSVALVKDHYLNMLASLVFVCNAPSLTTIRLDRRISATLAKFICASGIVSSCIMQARNSHIQFMQCLIFCCQFLWRSCAPPSKSPLDFQVR